MGDSTISKWCEDSWMDVSQQPRLGRFAIPTN